MVDIGAIESQGPNTEISRTMEFLHEIKPKFEQATFKIKQDHAYSTSNRAGALSFGLGRLLLDQSPKLPFRGLDTEDPRENGIYFMHGEKRQENAPVPHNWLEVKLEEKTILINPLVTPSDKADSFETIVVDSPNADQIYFSLGLRRVPIEQIANSHQMDWYNGRGYLAEDVAASIQKNEVHYWFQDWWQAFKEHYDFHKATPAIEEFIHNLPNPNRDDAITKANEARVSFLLNIWRKELTHLPSELIDGYNLTPDEQGWNNYLQMVFKKQSEYYKKFGFKDWSTKFMLEMLNTQAEEERKKEVSQVRESGSSQSFYEKMQKSGRWPEIWWGRVRDIDPESLLVHSIDENSLVRVEETGRIGRGGIGEIAFCQDRVAYDRGWIVVFQAKDILAAGYPLIKIDEDPRDAGILREWRSAALDIKLARAIIPTSDIPDREMASKAQIATSFFGEDYLKKLPRI